ncbi:borealin isoform X2 [Sitodiplosis mosellana]|uniref:borealin isoform X2 n=1 Tax=Sitodiplosis mosellana TaxID=263140 RepID=UPI00244393BF|nr:borealin isoform X2 [Sitodiplosis mosellana]
MPRTKLNKKVTNKRNRNSTADDLRVNAMSDVDREMETMLTEFKFKQEEQRDQIRNRIANIKSKLSTALLEMKIGVLKELTEQSMKSYEQVQDHINTNSGPLANITNQTLNSISMSSAKVSKTDDGDSVRSDVSRSARPVGPFQSAKAKSRRRSRSLSSVIQSYTKGAPRTQQLMKSRESRSKFRTPINNRIQSISADRMMNPVTPKMEAGRAIAMLRYAKQGETVISLQGSPVVATSVLGNNANLNIPLADGVICIQPAMGGSLDPELVSRIDKQTLDELRRLQDNIDMIMQCAANSM